MASRRDSRRTGLWPLSYMGVEPVSPPLILTDDRAPTTNDYKNFNVGTLWVDRNTAPLEDIYMLVNKDNNVARWIKISVVGGAAIETLTGNNAVAVGPDAAKNIDIVGSGPYTITGNAGTWTLTLSDDGTLATSYLTDDANSAVPAANVLTVAGGLNIDTSSAGSTVTIATPTLAEGPLYIDATGAYTSLGTGNDGEVLIGQTGGDPAWSTITAGTGITIVNGANSITLSVTGYADLATQFDTDSGSAVPAAGILEILGDGTFLATSGAGNTVTVDLADSVGTDGQVIIGATGGSPAWANITSTGGTITVSNGANTINLEAVAGPGFVNAGDNININPVNTVNLNETIHWPATNAAGTTGVIYYGGAGGAGGYRIFHNYGSATTIKSNLFIGKNAGNFTLDTTQAVENIGIGEDALKSLTTGLANTAVGLQNLQALTSGYSNTAIGEQAGRQVTTGHSNTFIGNGSGLVITTGIRNTGLGTNSLLDATTPDYSTAIGYDALRYLLTGNYNIALGAYAGDNYTGTESDNIVIGNNGVLNDNNTIRIGTEGTGNGQQDTCFIAGIYTSSVTGRDVYAKSDGQIGYLSSSERYKENIEDMAGYSDAMMSLRPVIFNYKEDESKLRCYGLIAEEVDKVMPELVDRDPDGTIQTVRYNHLISMLLNEVQKLSKRVEELEKK